MASEIRNRFTDTEMQIARETDLPELLSHLGYQVKRVGRFHTTAEMDSLRIKDRRTWFRYSQNTGGDAITFLQQFCGKSFPEAVEYLLTFHGKARDAPIPQPKPISPKAHRSSGALHPAAQAGKTAALGDVPRRGRTVVGDMRSNAAFVALDADGHFTAACVADNIGGTLPHGGDEQIGVGAVLRQFTLQTDTDADALGRGEQLVKRRPGGGLLRLFFGGAATGKRPVQHPQPDLACLLQFGEGRVFLQRPAGGQ